MVHGIVNVYKEKGYTSFDVVARMRGIFHQKKIGHTGTLDPDAEGVLPVCLGTATKVCDLLTDWDKEYETVLLLGRTTDTQDVSGQTLSESPVDCTNEQVRDAVMGFVGSYAQVPPMYSALKVDGQKLCDLARKGVTVERKPREVQIYAITILDLELPRVRMRVCCSKGTYIRTLCQDIGETLGCGGCMESLLRTRVGDFRIEDALRLDDIQRIVHKAETIPDNIGLCSSEGGTDTTMGEYASTACVTSSEPTESASGRNKEATVCVQNMNKLLRNIDSLFPQIPAVQTLPAADKLVRNGNRIPRKMVQAVPYSDARQYEYQKENQDGREQSSPTMHANWVRLYRADGMFVGIYAYMPDARDYKPVKLFFA